MSAQSNVPLISIGNSCSNCTTNSVTTSTGSSSQSEFESMQTQFTDVNESAISVPLICSNSVKPEGNGSVLTSETEVFTTACEETIPKETLDIKPMKYKCVKIILHGNTNIEHILPEEDYDRTVEEVYIKQLKENYPKMGPAAIQLFGLASFDYKQNPKILWKNPNCTIKSIMEHQNSNADHKQDQKFEFYVRIRFVPKYPNQLQRLQELGSDLLEYMFYQSSDDFRTERFRLIFGNPLRTSAQNRGLAVIHMLALLRKERISSEEIKSRYEIEHFLPPAEIPKSFLNKLKKHKLLANLYERLDEISKSQSASVEELMITYVKEVLTVVDVYGIEHYEAKPVGKEEEKNSISILINVHIEEAKKKGLYMDGQLFSRIEDMRNVTITKAFQKKYVNVHLDRSEGFSQVIAFSSMEIAESFVSGLNGYYRLMSDYYMSLCQVVEPPSQRHLSKLRCHGPTLIEKVVEKLKTRYSHEQYYILKQSVTEFNSYAILFSQQEQIRKWIIIRKNGKFQLEKNKKRVFDSLEGVVRYMVEVKNLPENRICVRPKQEPCHNLRRLFFKDDDDDILEEEDIEQRVQSSNHFIQPTVFHSSDIKIESLKDTGRFTEVHVGYLLDGKQVAVKNLRKTDKKQMLMCYEPFQESIEKLLQIEEHRFFVAMYGISLSTPMQLIMEYAQYGSLLLFLREKKPEQILHFQHSLSAAIQISQGLLYLQEKKMVHGNICCSNILLFKYDLEMIMKVKIGDSGMVSLLNSLPVDHEENRRRTPWLAPELFRDLRKMTINTDVYAFGTTLWEIFSYGRNPYEDLDFHQLDTRTIRERLLKHKLPLPQSLDVRKVGKQKVEESEYMRNCKVECAEVMQKCWTENPESRPGASEMLKTLHSAMTMYGQYNVYTEIPVDPAEDDSGSFEETNPKQFSTTMVNVPRIPTMYDTPDEKPSPDFNGVSHAHVSQLPASELIALPTGINDQKEQDTKPADNSVKRRSLPEIDMDMKYLIPSVKLVIDGHLLGKGHYGEVKKGKLYRTQNRSDQPIPIAAKILKGEFMNVIDSPEFKEEANIMSGLQHDNIVKFIGISNDMLILEFVENGSLNIFLRKRRKKSPPEYLPARKLVLMCLEVAEGMEYLYSKKIIHCDLASRNVLVTGDEHMKISDFGLAKELQKDKDYYRRSVGKDLPALWCSPEALEYRRFTVKSDIWSYAVLIWEIFSHCKSPILAAHSKDHVRELRQGKRLTKPSSCPDDIYIFMKKCWDYDPVQRPDFQITCQKFQEFYKTYKHPVTKNKNPNFKDEDSTTSKPDQSNKVHSPVPCTNVPAEPTQLSSQKAADNSPSIKVPTGITNKAADNSPSIKVPTGITNKGNYSIVTSNVMTSVPQCENPPSKQRPRPTLPSQTLGFLIAEQKLEQFEDKVLGSGVGGVVIKGLFTDACNIRQEVAIKKLIDVDINKDKVLDAFKQEVDNIGSAEHENIVKFYGYRRNPEFLIVMELVENGSLKMYLDGAREKGLKIAHARLLKICIDVANGMDYLSSKNIVHCDLAARNVLLTKEYKAKITDFGLSKALKEDEDYYIRKRNCNIPFMYMAPEYFDRQKLSVKGDVWGYGVLMWECFSMGLVPNLFGEVDKVGEFKKLAYYVLHEGNRLRQTENCPDDVYQLMEKCWKWLPEERPSFPSIYQRCLVLQETIGYDEVS